MTSNNDTGGTALYSSLEGLLKEAQRCPQKNRNIKRTRKRSKPNQVTIYGETICRLKKEGHTNRSIEKMLGITGVSTIYFRYRTQLNNTENNNG